MCGIVGYVGDREASEVIIDGLSRLEYRGYDSAGISVIDDINRLNIRKKQGRLAVLEEFLGKNPIAGHIAVGHTRWATHGKPSDNNSHPHLNSNNSISVVHNGIIENYIEIKKELIAKGYEFKSDTDSEVIVHLLDLYLENDFFKTIQKVLVKIRGSYALGILNTKYPDTLFCARKDSPLVIGIGENENFIASDVPALLKYTKNVYFLDNGEIGVVKKESIEIYDIEKNRVNKTVKTIEWTLEQATKAGYPHFMLKEIHEQPKGISETIKKRVQNDRVIFNDINLDIDELKSINNIYIVACGTAYNAGLQGKFALQKIAKIKVDCDIASEFRYSDPFIDNNTLVILVSQSGETLDTLAALREAKAKGAKTLAITNVIESSIAREVNNVIYTWAGPEIAVASTKTYTTQITVFYMLALYIADLTEVISKEKYKNILKVLYTIPDKVQEIFVQKDKIKIIAEKIKDAQHGFYLGRGLDYSIAIEASLKMKEVAYIHTEAFASGELKHGTIALIEEGIPVIAIVTQQKLFEKSISNIKEVKARGAYVIALTQKGNNIIEEISDDIIYIPECEDIISGILAVVPLQLLAYYVSDLRGLDVDKPRNLAKSVTVE